MKSKPVQARMEMSGVGGTLFDFCTQAILPYLGEDRVASRFSTWSFGTRSFGLGMVPRNDECGPSGKLEH